MIHALIIAVVLADGRRGWHPLRTVFRESRRVIRETSFKFQNPLRSKG